MKTELGKGIWIERLKSTLERRETPVENSPKLKADRMISNLQVERESMTMKKCDKILIASTKRPENVLTDLALVGSLKEKVAETFISKRCLQSRLRVKAHFSGFVIYIMDARKHYTKFSVIKIPSNFQRTAKGW